MIQDNRLDNMIDRSLNYGRQHVDAFLRFVGQDSMDVVLDIGAGRGSDLLLARSVNPSAKLHALETYTEYRRELQQKGISVHSGDAERDLLPFSEGAVDVVIVNQILEHVKEIFWVLHEITRVVRVGGHVIIGVPNLASLHNRLLLLLGRQPTCIQNHSAHVRGYTKRDLLNLLEICFPGGYRLVKFGGGNFYPFPPSAAKMLAAVFPNMAWGIFFLLRKERPYKREFLTHPVQHNLETNFFLGPH